MSYIESIPEHHQILNNAASQASRISDFKLAMMRLSDVVGPYGYLTKALAKLKEIQEAYAQLQTNDGHLIPQYYGLGITLKESIRQLERMLAEADESHAQGLNFVLKDFL